MIDLKCKPLANSYLSPALEPRRHMNNNTSLYNSSTVSTHQSYIISDDILLSSLNTKLNITEEKLKLTMDEMIQACQEKYPYKFI